MPFEVSSAHFERLILGDVFVGEVYHNIVAFYAFLKSGYCDVGNAYDLVNRKVSGLCGSLTGNYCGRYNP